MHEEIREGTLYLKKKDEAFLYVFGTNSVLDSLSNFFSFFAPGYQWTPKFKMRLWDGRIRLFSTYNNEIYLGLLPHVVEFAKLHDYKVEYIDNDDLEVEEEFSVKEAQEFAASLDIHAEHDGEWKSITPHDYQINAFRHAVQTNRCLLLSPTASGKSLIIYLLIRYYQQFSKKKILIVVPTTGLVSQLYSDFGEYSYADQEWDVRNECHQIFEGQDKASKDKQIYLSTWQSIYKLSPEYFQQFEKVVVDEVHLAKAESLTSIMKKCTKAKYRFGLTGTLDGTKVHKTVLEGLFGKVNKVISTIELMEQGKISDMKINCLMLHYPESVCKSLKSATYQDEISFIVASESRNRFIRNLALSLKGNTLILYNLVERHGKPLYEDILKHAKDGRKVFFISGKVETEVREDIRKITETETDAILVASFGTFSTGSNIRNLHNVILAQPVKGQIRLCQSLGRGLRKSKNKSILNLYDLSDNLSYKTHKNATLKHFEIRVEIYAKEQFNYKLFKVNLKS